MPYENRYMWIAKKQVFSVHYNWIRWAIKHYLVKSMYKTSYIFQNEFLCISAFCNQSCNTRISTAMKKYSRRFLYDTQWEERVCALKLRVNICDLLHFFLAKHDRDYLNHGASELQGNKWNMMEKVTEIRIDDLQSRIKNKWVMRILCPTTYLMMNV